MRAIKIELAADTRRMLERWARRGKGEHRLAVRSQIILDSADGLRGDAIAARLKLSPWVVSKWRKRFVAGGLLALRDAPRSGAPVKYDAATARRVLAMLDQPPPAGQARWTGRLVAQALGDVPADFVWKTVRQHGLHLARRRSWCISTDPEFTPKAADIVGLYLAPPEHAVVLCVDEKPSIQALERAQGWLRLADGKTLTGFADRYTRHGTSTLFAALEVATGMVKTGHYGRRRRREFLDFMNGLVADYPGQHLHVILDNLNTHKPKHDRWLQQHPEVTFHYTPTNASWLNQIEIWFSILSRQALAGASFTSVHALRCAIDAFTAAYCQQATPFEWKKVNVHPKTPQPILANLIR
jgi:transposase